MSRRVDKELKLVAESLSPLGTLTDDDKRAIHNIYDYFSNKGGGVASSVITTNQLCGGKGRKQTRTKRAKQIRASHVKELQAAGLLPLGTLFWLWWSSPIGWRFLLQWILEVMADAEDE